MEQAIAGILKIVIFLLLGILFRKKKVLDDVSIWGIKKLILFLAIPSVLFRSFSRLTIDLQFLPIILSIFFLNLILFVLGLLVFKWKKGISRLFPLYISTMNFALLGLPLFEAVYGAEKLQHYTQFGVGHEIYMWFVFYFLFARFLKGKSDKTGFNWGFLKTPVIWGIVLGCLFSILQMDLSSYENPIVKAFVLSIDGSAALAGPLILIFLGFNLSVSVSFSINSFKLVISRFLWVYALGYIIKYSVLDRFLESSLYNNSAYFLFLSLPPVFSLPILASDYLEEEETKLLNNSIIVQALLTIVLFAVYSLIRI